MSGESGAIGASRANSSYETRAVNNKEQWLVKDDDKASKTQHPNSIWEQSGAFQL